MDSSKNEEEQLFVLSYSTKFWGAPTDEIRVKSKRNEGKVRGKGGGAYTKKGEGRGSYSDLQRYYNVCGKGA